MKKFVILLSVLAFFNCIYANPLVEYDASKNKIPVFFSLIGQNGTFKKCLPGKSGVVLNGKNLLVLKNNITGAQTVYVSVKYSKKPSGALISRHRTLESCRGYEAGFADKAFFDMNGRNFAMQISSGKRSDITDLFDEDAPELACGKVYDCFLIYTPGETLCFTAVDKKAQSVLFERSIAAPEKLSSKAGENLLCIGGRRNSSKSAECFAPAGTTVLRAVIWDRALTIKEIEKFLKYNIKREKSSVKSAADTPSKRSVKNPSKAVKMRKTSVIYVDCNNGNDKNDGLSIKKAFRSIQRAADTVKAGDKVVIMPGVYFEKVNLRATGTREQPIIFEGRGDVIITAADRNLREKKSLWKLENKEKNIYSTPFKHNPARLLVDGKEMYPYPDKKSLENAALPNGYPSTEHGYCFEEQEKRLYIRFRGEHTPEKSLICAAPVNAPGSNGQHVWHISHGNFLISARTPDGWIRLRNLTFETPGAAGVITFAGNIAVTDCSFTGCRFGVSGVKKPENIFIENCDYSQKGIYNDVMDIIKRAQQEKLNEKFRFYFWAHKGMFCNYDKMKNFETGIVGGAGRNWHIRNCRIDDSFEGFSSWCASNAEDMQVYGNIFRKIVDNAVETENNVKNIRVYNNYFEDVFEPVSWQPLAGPPWPGPVFVYRNVIKTTDDFKLHADALEDFMPGVFKLGVSGRNWQYPREGNVPTDVIAARTSKRFVGAPGEGFLVFNNTIIHPDGGLMTTPNPLDGRALRELVNFRFFNNIIAVKRMHISKKWRAPLVEFYSNIVQETAENEFHRGIMSQENGKMFDSFDELGVSKENFELAEKSPALKNGILHFEEPDASLDCGAVPRNSKFIIHGGKGTAQSMEKLSQFRRKTHYDPEFIRTLHSAGNWAVYSFNKEKNVELDIPENVRGICFEFRITDCTRPHENLKRVWKLFKSRNFNITLSTVDGKTSLELCSGKSVQIIEAGNLERDRFYKCKINFGSNGYVELDGKIIKNISINNPDKGTAKISIGRNMLYDIKFLNN